MDALLPALAALCAGTMAALQASSERRRLTAALATEQARVSRLTETLMAVQAPAPYAAYMASTPTAPLPRFHYSDDGLIAFPVDDNE